MAHFNATKVKNSIIRKRMQKAREKLIAKGIMAIDGSGDPDVEAVFNFLTWIRNGTVVVVNDDKVLTPDFEKRS